MYNVDTDSAAVNGRDRSAERPVAEPARRTDDGGMRSAEDTLAIQAVVVLYGFLVDDREWDRFDQVFTSDAVVDFRDLSAEPPRGLAPIVGRAEIVRQFRDVLTHPYQHMLVNHVIEDVSPDEVVVRSKALLPLPGGSVADIVYRDVVIRTPDGWRISGKTTKRYNFDPPAVWGAEQARIWASRGAQFT